MIVRLDAGHNRNGNPRRCYVLYNDNGQVTTAFNEGYYGYMAVPVRYRKDAQAAPTIPTTTRHYRDMLMACNKEVINAE